MSTKVDQAKQVPDAATQSEKKKIFQSNYKLEKQFLPRHDEKIPEKENSTKRKIHLMRKIQEIVVFLMINSMCSLCRIRCGNFFVFVVDGVLSLFCPKWRL